MLVSKILSSEISRLYLYVVKKSFLNFYRIQYIILLLLLWLRIIATYIEDYKTMYLCG